MVSESDFYREFLSRVASLNDNQKSYRVTFIVLIGAYYTAVQFLLGERSSITSDSSVDTVVIILYLLSVVALAGSCIIAFFDFIAQELIEDCLRGAEKIEISSSSLREKRIFVLGHKRKNVTSLRISITLALFYFVPILCMYAVCWILADSIVFRGESDFNSAMAEEICSRIAMLQSNASELRGVICDSDRVYVLFTEQTVKITALIHVFALGLFSYYIFYSARRIVPRFVKEIVEVQFFGFVVKLTIRGVSTVFLPFSLLLMCFRKEKSPSVSRDEDVQSVKGEDGLSDEGVRRKHSNFRRTVEWKVRSIWRSPSWMREKIKGFAALVESVIRSFMWLFIGSLWFILFGAAFADESGPLPDQYARFIVRPFETLKMIVND